MWSARDLLSILFIHIGKGGPTCINTPINAQIHLFIHSFFQKSLIYPQSLSRKNFPGVTGFFCSSLVTTIGHTSLNLYEAIELVHMTIITGPRKSS